MHETALGVNGAAALVDAWLEEPTREAHAQHLRNLTTQSPEAAEHLVAGLTMLAAGLAFSLSQLTEKPMRTVLAEMAAAVNTTNKDS